MHEVKYEEVVVVLVLICLFFVASLAVQVNVDKVATFSIGYAMGIFS